MSPVEIPGRARILGERTLNASSGLAVQFPDGTAREHFAGFAVLPLAGQTTGAQVDVWLDRNSGDALRLPVGVLVPLPFETVWLRSIDTTTPRYRVVAFRELPPAWVDFLVRSVATSGLVPLVGVVDGDGDRLQIDPTSTAARATLYYSDGVACTISVRGTYRQLNVEPTGVAKTGIDTAASSGSVNPLSQLGSGFPGALLVADAVPEQQTSGENSTGAAAVDVIAAPGASLRLYVKEILVSVPPSVAASTVVIDDTVATYKRIETTLNTQLTLAIQFGFNGLRLGANLQLRAHAGGTVGIRVSASAAIGR